MDAIRDYLVIAGNYIKFIGVADIADMLIVAFVVYKLLGLIKKTNSYRVAKGVLIIIACLWLSGVLKLNAVNFLLRKTVEIGLLALVVLFQPELRRILERVGSSRVKGLLVGEIKVQTIETAITQTVLACVELSKTKTGALIIFERSNSLDDQMNTGTLIYADTTAELLKNIFYPKAPLHDGAAIIREGRIASAGCMLPLSTNVNLSRDLGMRHRAGIGMSERSDAVVVIISEETGSISVAVDGMLKRHLTPDTFEKLLRNELINEEPAARKGALAWLGSLFKGNGHEK